MTASRVLVARRLPVGADEAFRAFTERIGQWWRPHGLFQFTPGRSGSMSLEPGPGGRLVETYPDGDRFVVGRVLAWEPPHRLVMSWRHANFADEETTELHVRFEDVAEAPGTSRVTVEHFGWDTIPADHAARHGFPLASFQLRWAEWWQSLLAAIVGDLGVA